MAVWNVLEKYNPQKNILSQILINRGVKDERLQQEFLSPLPIASWFKKLPDEFLSAIKTARDLIRNSIKNNDLIIIHGDYDVDGVCAAYILFYTIKNILKYDNVYIFIPNRFEHGYGLSSKSIDFLEEKFNLKLGKSKCLMITVDSGITSINEVERLSNLGCRTIITDHHQKPTKLPTADCIVWYDQIVGTTISWLCSISLGLKETNFVSYCALATITDLQPVVGFNRSIVKAGLEIINSAPPLGLKSLLEVSGRRGGEVDTYDLGFVLGPRLNATGRIEDASKSLDLLLADDINESQKIAWELNQINSTRQDKTSQMYELAGSFEFDNGLPEVIISHHEDYHEGIIGLVASMLVQKYNRPSIVISISGEIAKGSVRSIPGINIIEMLRELENMFLSLGGHPMAAGFSIETKNLDRFSHQMSKLAKKQLSKHTFEKYIDVDLEIPISKLNIETVEDLEKLKPYGLGNTQPVFCSRSVGISSFNYVGAKNNHLSLKLFDGENFYKAIFFNALEMDIALNQADKVDIVYTAKINNYNQKKQVEFIIKDLIKVS